MPRSVSDPGGASRTAIGLGLVFVCLVVYANALGNPMLFDDVAVIEESARVTGGDFGRLLTGEYWEGGHSDRLYRPLVSLSFGINWAISQSPAGFRWVNLLLHAMVCLVVFQLTLELFGERYGTAAAVAAAGLFAVHPVHTEPINSIVGRADLAMTLLSLSAAWIWWRDRREPAEGWRRPIAAAACFAAALLSKESAITLPGIVLLLDVVRGAEGDSGDWWKRRIRRCYLPLLAVIAGFLALRLSVLGQLTSGAEIRWFENPAAMPAEMLGPGAVAALVRWATPLAAFARSAGLMVVPAPLVHDSSYPAFLEVSGFGDPRLWYGLGWAVVLAVVMLLSLRRRREMLLALGLALIPYSVVSNFVVPIGTIFGERLLYMPSVGACIGFGLLFGAALDKIGDRLAWRRLSVGALLVTCAVFGWLTIDRNRDWSSAEALILSVGDGDDASFKVLDAFADRELRRGERLKAAGRVEESHRAFFQAAEYAGRAAAAVPESWGPISRMGEVQMHLGELEGALSLFERAIEMGAGGDLRTLQRAALVASSLGRYADSVTYLEGYLDRSIDLAGDDRARTHIALAVAYMQQGPQQNAARAVEHGQAAAGLQPASPIVDRVLSGALLLDGKPEQALAHARRAVAAFPERGEVRMVLIRALDGAGRRAEAIEAAREALTMLAPDDRLRPTVAAQLEALSSGPDDPRGAERN